MKLIINDASPEIERIQFEMMMKFSPNKRIRLGCEMFMAARELFIVSLSKNLSEKEFKKQLYFRAYGEHLSEDFFDREDLDKK